MVVYNFNSVPTIKAFFLDRHRIKLIIGPFGSGKSSGCVISLMYYMQQQQPNSEGVRKTRYVIVRNTTKELKDTTKKTVEDWVMPIMPVWKESELTYTFDFMLPDKTRVHSEWLFRALDRPDQVKDLLSLEVTGAWLNEAREIPKEIFDAMDGRIERFPSKRECTYPFIIMDSNPPDIDHWLYKMFEEDRLKDEKLAEKIAIFKQPSGLSAEAENLPNLPENYYQNLMVGKDEDYINVYIHGRYGYTKEGKPVYTNFTPSLHIREVSPIRGVDLIIGMDFGLFPACVITQQTIDGRLLVLDEIVTEDPTDLEEFISILLLPLLYSKYRGYQFMVYGDPAGKSRSQLDSRTCFSVLRSRNIKAYPTYTNALQPRLSAVNQFLTRTVRGEPGFQIHPNCRTLIKALANKYVFRRVRVSGEKYTSLPEKNFYSHVADALGYACLGYIPHPVSAGEEFVEDVKQERPRISII